MQLLFYEGATNTVTTGLAYVIPNETAELKTKLLYLFFLLWTMPTRIVCKTGLSSSPITNLSNWNLALEFWLVFLLLEHLRVQVVEKTKSNCGYEAWSLLNVVTTLDKWLTFFSKIPIRFRLVFCVSVFSTFFIPPPPCFCCFTKEIRGIGVG